MMFEGRQSINDRIGMREMGGGVGPVGPGLPAGGFGTVGGGVTPGAQLPTAPSPVPSTNAGVPVGNPGTPKPGGLGGAPSPGQPNPPAPKPTPTPAQPQQQTVKTGQKKAGAMGAIAEALAGAQAQGPRSFAGVGSKEALARGLQGAVFSSKSLFSKPSGNMEAGGGLRDLISRARGNALRSQGVGVGMQPGATIAMVGNPGGSVIPPSGLLGLEEGQIT